jgi:hypothetical protein
LDRLERVENKDLQSLGATYATLSQELELRELLIARDNPGALTTPEDIHGIFSSGDGEVKGVKVTWDAMADHGTLRATACSQQPTLYHELSFAVFSYAHQHFDPWIIYKQLDVKLGRDIPHTPHSQRSRGEQVRAS